MTKFVLQLGVVVLIFATISCSTQKRRIERSNSASIAQTAKKRVVKTDSILSTHGSNVRVISDDKSTQFITDVELGEDGEAISVVNIDEIVVTSTLKTLPERFGYVVVDFVVSVPQSLANKDWSIVLTPVVNRKDSVIRLEKVVITGKKVREFQQKCYWRYNDALNEYKTESFRRRGRIEREQDNYIKRDILFNKWKRDFLTHQQEGLQKKYDYNPLEERLKRFMNKSLPIGYISGDFVGTTKYTAYDSRSIYFQEKSARIDAHRTKTAQQDNTSNIYMSRADYAAQRITDKTPHSPRRAYLNLPSDSTITEQGMEFASKYLLNTYEANVRVDTTVAALKNYFRYHYIQDVKTDENIDKFSLTMSGVAKHKSIKKEIKLPVSDTLTYTVTSMLSMIDSADRYVYNIVSKYATVNERNFIAFPLGKSAIIDTLGGNHSELKKVKKLMHSLLYQYEFFIDTITITAASSPEGRSRLNDKLSRERANALRDYLVNEFDQNIDTLITVKWIAEDWAGLRNLILQDNTLQHKSEIVDIIHSTANTDSREALIKRRYPSEYKYMLKELYPKLRAVNFKYNLRRVGMIQDTVYTTEIDTLYKRGFEYLKKRKYKEALYILDKYKDINTAITLMSLGYDKAALEIILTTPETAERHYLTAILLTRLKRLDQALVSFRKACKAKSSLKYRGNLDPEIQVLLKHFNININNEEDF